MTLRFLALSVALTALSLSGCRPEEVDPVKGAKAKFHKEKKQLTVSARIVG